MKKSLKIITLTLCIIMALSVLAASVYAAPGEVANQGEVKSESIKVNGVDTGAVLTQITLPAKTGYNTYSSNSVVNVIEVAPSSGLTFAALNCGNYTYNTSTIGTAANKYNSTHEGTVIAAINADPWFLYHSDYDGDGVKATGVGAKHQSITRNMLIVDGEIYQTTQVALENWLNNNSSEWGTGVTPHLVFAQKDDGSFMIGRPWLQMTITNDTTGTFDTEAQGINRLPAPGAIMIYNQRVGTESMAHEDAYEIYLETENSAFSIGGTVTGKVVGIYASGETNRPNINDNTVIISARGKGSVPATYKNANGITQSSNITDMTEIVKDQFSIGDTVSISVGIRTSGRGNRGDTYNQDQADDWNNVTNAMGGFFAQVEKGVIRNETATGAYPAPLIALKEDGTAMMITVTSKLDVRAGAPQSNLGEICKELGAYTAIMFDGGGSTSMITYDDGAYVRRTGYADGSVRNVVNALGLVYGGANVDDITNNENAAYTEIGGKGTAPDIVGTASSSYRYYSNIDFINGKGADGSETAYRGVNSVRNGSTGEYSTATVSGGMSTDDKGKLTITGWAVVNSGQRGHFWSVDGTNWYECADIKYNQDMSNWDDILSVSTSNAALTSTSSSKAKSKFTDATIDLSAYNGQTVDVYFGACHAGGGIALIVKVEDVSVSLHEHTAGDAATCTTAQTCTGCGEVIAEALGHDEQSHEAKAATCTEGGYEAYVSCSRCDYSTKADTAPLGHDEVSHEAKVATCVESGYEAYVTCSRCDYTTQSLISATGIHTYDGETDADCNVCGEIREINTEGDITPPDTSTGDGENDGEENNTENNTEGNTEGNTEADTDEAPATPENPDGGKNDNGGCGSTIGFGAIAMIASIALAGSVICKKRR